MITNLVGTRIRAIRAKRNLTQQQLADLAKIPRATLASVERDDGNPSLAVVHKIASALGTTIDDLIVEEHQRVQAIRKNKMQQLESGDGAYQATIISPADARHMLQQIFHLKAHSSYEGKPHPPGSEEYLHILKGEVLLEVAGESVRLKQGDSARFGGNVHHLYTNPSGAESIGLVTILEKRDIG
ncbi:MAG TPA: XRE family transcriptional regulator [Sedimenticola sp.]|nr:XRE family transcriptional regulator [Sedimenticola sp.]